MTRQRRRARRLAGAGLVAALLAVTAGCGAEDSRTTLVFFQFKAEAVQQFDDLAREFEAQNPDIRIVVDTVPDPETALRTRLVKDDMPDVLSLNANGTFGELASAGLFKDFTGTQGLADVNPAYLEVIQELGAGTPGEVNGVPFAANASGVLYNVELFEEQGIEVPTTWEELVATAETFEAAGITPFYGMLGEAWTAQSPLAPLSAQTAPEGFLEDRHAGQATFTEGWQEAYEKLGVLYEYTQPEAGARNYQDGTRAFADGESAMLLLGSFAVPQIRSFEPDFTVGSFALPATDDPAQTTLVSGVDVVFTAPVGGEHDEQAQQFIDFLMQPGNVEVYAEAQVAVPVLTGLENDDPALQGVQSYIDEERIVGFTDHQFIPAIPLDRNLQEFLGSGASEEAALEQLDTYWDQVAQRRTWGLGAVQEG